MKNTILYLCIVAFTAIIPMSCDDDDTVTPSVPAQLLTKISRNGITYLEFLYDLDRKLARVNYYTPGGQLSEFILYDYGPGGVVETRLYENIYTLEYRGGFTLDNFGRIAKLETYGSSSNFTDVVIDYTFTYDPSGRLIKKRGRLTNEPPSFTEEFSYDGTNHLMNIKRTNHQEQDYVSQETDFTPGDKSIPDHWAGYVPLLDVYHLEDIMQEMFNTVKHHKSWTSKSKLNFEYRTEATERQFDSNGYLTRQILTRVNMSPSSPDNIVEMTYEYAQ